MVKIDSEVKQLTVREFLSDGQYVIPIYQRNYDWGERETLQLLEDISDYAQKNSNQKYYIGYGCCICSKCEWDNLISK